jgi:RNA polymerase sigma-70 factor, ECF subfamily
MLAPDLQIRGREHVAVREIELNGAQRALNVDLAFLSWYRQYRERLTAWCQKLLNDRGAAEDAAQEALLRAWTHREQFDGDGDIGPWLFSVARNLCMDTLRSRRRLVPLEHLSEAPDRTVDPSEPFDAEEERRAVRTALTSLSSRHRQMLYLRDVEGLDYAELASKLGVSEEGARAVLFRARRGLRSLLQAAGQGTLGVFGLARIRIRAGMRRVLEHARTVEPAAQVVQSLGVLALAAGLALAGTGSGRLSPTPVTGGISMRSAVVTAAERLPANAPSRGGIVQTRPIAPRPPTPLFHEVKVGHRWHNPLTGSDEYWWVGLWRQRDGRASVVLGTADGASAAACGNARSTCETLDGVLSGAGRP